MSLWKSTDANTSAPLYALSQLNVSPTQANMNIAYGNVTTSAYFTNANVGIFGVDTTEQGVSATTANHAQHAGWVLRKAGTGGRAGRVQTEVLVAMGSMTSDGTANTNDDLVYQDTAS